MNGKVSSTLMQALNEVKQPSKPTEEQMSANVGISSNILDQAKDSIQAPKPGFVEISDAFCIMLLIEERKGDDPVSQNSVRFISTIGNKGVFTTIFHYLKRNYLEKGYYLFDMRYNKEADALKSLSTLTLPMILLETEAQEGQGSDGVVRSFNLRFYLDKNAKLDVDE